ncbi:MAG: orotidine-5'-phosphate decarboxylase [Spirochaetales bacterium]|nr:orotidine-5'-phosphate decarboxylase [Spirochaetales bacterium]
MNNKKEEFIKGLYEIGAVRFGKFTLKSGIESPFYLDLRKVISYPKLHSLMCSMLSDYAAGLDFDCVLGIPYTALPSASIIAETLKKPLFMLRKEVKTYGAGGKLVGDPDKKGKCLIVDDLVTTGGSKFETADELTSLGFGVKDILVVVDRSADAVNELSSRGLVLHSLVSLEEIVQYLNKTGCLDDAKVEEIKSFTKTLPEKEKALKTDNDVESNKFTNKLLDVIKRKKSNLILSLDTEDPDEFFDILEKTSKSIVMVKTHVDIIRNFTPDFLDRLKKLAEKGDFLIFEDRKFADIGNTVKHQFYGGVYRIAEWADCVTSHLIAGEGTVKGLFPDGEASMKAEKPQAAFLLARMSSKGNLITEYYSKKVIEAGKDNFSVVSGYIGHGKDVEDIKQYKSLIPKGQLLLMPGVKLERGSDNLGQQYLTVEEAVTGGADCIIVGRGIIKAEDPQAEAEIYRERAWNVFCKRGM